MFDPREIDGPGKEVIASGKGKRLRDQHGRPIRAGPSYAPGFLERLVAKACLKAGVPHWHPNQLRHLMATRIQSQYSLDVARAILGHADAQMTTRYAAADLKAASEAIERIG